MDTKTISLRMDQIFSNFIKKGILTEEKTSTDIKVGDEFLKVYADNGDLRRVIAGEKTISQSFLILEMGKLELKRFSNWNGAPSINADFSFKDEEISFSKSRKTVVDILELAEKLSKPRAKKSKRVTRVSIEIVMIGGNKYKLVK
jgi:hypothetical protein